MGVLNQIGQALFMAFGMFWAIAWSLALGFLLSACIQVLVPKRRVAQLLGKDTPKEIALAVLFGAVSSSCSYASAAISKTLFKKGAAFIPSLAFLFASTNLVIELGIVLFVLMGWPFTVAEWFGGIILVIIMTLLVRLTYPKQLIEEARHYVEGSANMPSGHDEMHETLITGVAGKNLWEKLKNPETRILIAQHFVMDWSMLWKDLVIGFFIAGVLSVFVPTSVWSILFVYGAPPLIQTILNALLGPLVALISFVCSIGNVPMAAVLWSRGISFGGILSFLYADLIVLPLLDVYRRYYGWRMATYIGVVFYLTMVLTGLLMDGLFTAAGWIPAPKPAVQAEMVHFTLNTTFFLNVVFGVLTLYMVYLSRKQPVKQQHCCH